MNKINNFQCTYLYCISIIQIKLKNYTIREEGNFQLGVIDPYTSYPQHRFYVIFTFKCKYVMYIELQVYNIFLSGGGKCPILPLNGRPWLIFNIL